MFLLGVSCYILGISYHIYIRATVSLQVVLGVLINTNIKNHLCRQILYEPIFRIRCITCTFHSNSESNLYIILYRQDREFLFFLTVLNGSGCLFLDFFMYLKWSFFFSKNVLRLFMTFFFYLSAAKLFLMSMLIRYAVYTYVCIRYLNF